jgi:hypothetical protein
MQSMSETAHGHLASADRNRFLAIASFVALLAMGGCTTGGMGATGGAGTTGAGGNGTGGTAGNGASNGTAAMRAACYPPCLADLVKRCPLVSACQADLETSSSVPLPGESMGVAACFSSGERERQATDSDNHAVVYVKATDGSECYAAVGDQSPDVETWDLSVGGQLFGSLTWDLTSGAVAVTCDGATTAIDITKPLCAGLPWQNTTACDPGQTCTFGPVPAQGAWDAGAPCDPTQCAAPPASKCQQDSDTLQHSVVTYETPTCDNVSGCMYPQSVTPCDHGCYMAACTAALASITDVQGNSGAVSVTGGSAPAGSPVTVTARTSPRGAADSISFEYGTCTSNTLCIMTDFLFMGLDPNTPAGQTDYDQWTVTVPAQTAGTVLQFELAVTAAGGGAMLSQASLGTPWSYTSR